MARDGVDDGRMYPHRIEIGLYNYVFILFTGFRNIYMVLTSFRLTILVQYNPFNPCWSSAISESLNANSTGKSISGQTLSNFDIQDILTNGSEINVISYITIASLLVTIARQVYYIVQILSADHYIIYLPEVAFYISTNDLVISTYCF